MPTLEKATGSSASIASLFRREEGKEAFVREGAKCEGASWCCWTCQLLFLAEDVWDWKLEIGCRAISPPIACELDAPRDDMLLLLVSPRF